MTGKGGIPLSLDVVSMRQWAEKHAEQVSIPIEAGYIDRLIARGAVTKERVEAVLRTWKPKPVLLCRDINDDGDEIVDGNHTYVALGWAWSIAQSDSMAPEGIQPRVNAYVFQPEHWRYFVVPASQLVKRK